MLSVSRRFSAVLLTLALAAGQLGVCAGWMPTPEARMACCLGQGRCPMHAAESQGDGVKRAVSQAEADSCCAASERDDAVPAPSIIVTSFGSLAVVQSPVPLLLPQAVTAVDGWRTLVPIPGTQIATHLLLSVLLL